MNVWIWIGIIFGVIAIVGFASIIVGARSDRRLSEFFDEFRQREQDAEWDHLKEIDVDLPPRDRFDIEPAAIVVVLREDQLDLIAQRVFEKFVMSGWRG